MFTAETFQLTFFLRKGAERHGEFMDCFTHHCSAAAALLTGDLWADLRGVHRIHHNGYSTEQQQPPEGEKKMSLNMR